MNRLGREVLWLAYLDGHASSAGRKRASKRSTETDPVEEEMHMTKCVPYSYLRLHRLSGCAGTSEDSDRSVSSRVKASSHEHVQDERHALTSRKVSTERVDGHLQHASSRPSEWNACTEDEDGSRNKDAVRVGRTKHCRNGFGGKAESRSSSRQRLYWQVSGWQSLGVCQVSSNSHGHHGKQTGQATSRVRLGRTSSSGTTAVRAPFVLRIRILSVSARGNNERVQVPSAEQMYACAAADWLSGSLALRPAALFRSQVSRLKRLAGTGSVSSCERAARGWHAGGMEPDYAVPGFGSWWMRVRGGVGAAGSCEVARLLKVITAAPLPADEEARTSGTLRASASTGGSVRLLRPTALAVAVHSAPSTILGRWC
ncbi:hypothetical protein RJ55_04414 [Drechmeria coniospora]|nr:hypothetical protein RJ55_04414 [Drechmeria coniospora]